MGPSVPAILFNFIRQFFPVKAAFRSAEEPLPAVAKAAGNAAYKSAIGQICHRYASERAGRNGVRGNIKKYN